MHENRPERGENPMLCRAPGSNREETPMNGFVTKLCDIDSIEIPKEMLEIHVDEQQLEEELSALSLRYAKEEPAEIAQEATRYSVRRTGRAIPTAEPFCSTPRSRCPVRRMRQSRRWAKESATPLPPFWQERRLA